ncbi:MAG TPA: glycosyltransferase family 4 protein [Longimicrobium sp.]|nr:glycosyltransferase family 4 protein [Longimicrobium sp.]
MTAPAANRRRRILYMVHSGGFGGALLSLRYLLEQIDKTRYEPVVACVHPIPEVMDVFRRLGLETIHAPGITTFSHTTLEWYPLTHPLGGVTTVRELAAFRRSARATERLVREVKPDLVHLNSLVFGAAAAGAKAAGAPVVWHIRENAAPGHLGVRRGLQARWLKRWGDRVIFISNDDRRALGGEEYGIVIHNFVDHGRFDRAIDGAPVREELGLPAGAKVALFFGGMNTIKGAHVFLQAVRLAKETVPGLHAVIAGAVTPTSSSLVARTARAVLPLLGGGTERQRFMKLYGGMEDFVHLLPFRHDPERLLAAADVAVIPFIDPHFARPAIEAAAMGTPVVASDVGGVNELVEHERTGLLVPARDPRALADGIARVLNDPALAARFGEAGYRMSLERFGAAQGIARVQAVYDDLLGEPAPASADDAGAQSSPAASGDWRERNPAD